MSEDTRPIEEFPEPQKALVLKWMDEKPDRPGLPTCPCGFVSGTKHIRKHRLACETWRVFCHRLKWAKKVPAP